MPLNRHRRSLLGLVAAAGCLLALVGCGSSSKPSQNASSRASVGLRFAACMRSHGVPNFPDPSTSGGGFQIKISSGLNPGSPSFKAAQAACGKLLPGGGPGAGPPSATMKARLLAVSKCMRAHGVSDFPDPTTTAPSGPTGYAAVLGANGVFLAVPSSIDVRSPAFKQAASVCHFGGPPGGR